MTSQPVSAQPNGHPGHADVAVATATVEIIVPVFNEERSLLGRREGGLSWQLLSFAAIGMVSTVANLALYALLRTVWPILLANLAALVITTLFNTEANRRFTFAARRTSTGRAHVQGLVVFGLYYLFTSASLLVPHALAPDPGRVVELAVLCAASLLGTAGRFLLLRGWVLRASQGKEHS